MAPCVLVARSVGLFIVNGEVGFSKGRREILTGSVVRSNIRICTQMPPHSSAEIELSHFLKAVEDGSVSLTPELEPQDVYAGNVCYIASNGWRIVVYNDANEWDYIDSITTSDGRIFNFNAIDDMPAVDAYEPSEEIAWIRYGIPGYRRFRCKECGTRLTRPKGGSMRPPFLCSDCQGRS